MNADSARIEIPALPAVSRPNVPSRVQVLPLADAASHTAELRLEMDAVPAGVMPGMFARVRLASGGTQARLSVPARAVVHRTELDAVYVVDGAGRAILRQVRLGEVRQDRVEILSGVSEGEQIALDPVATTTNTRTHTPKKQNDTASRGASRGFFSPHASPRCSRKSRVSITSCQCRGRVSRSSRCNSRSASRATRRWFVCLFFCWRFVFGCCATWARSNLS